jgi:hypothetical protein
LQDIAFHLRDSHAKYLVPVMCCNKSFHESFSRVLYNEKDVWGDRLRRVKEVSHHGRLLIVLCAHDVNQLLHSLIPGDMTSTWAMYASCTCTA